MMIVATAVPIPGQRCLLEPIPEIFEAAGYLRAGVAAISAGRLDEAEASIRKADIPAIRIWTEALWGSAPTWTLPSRPLRPSLVSSTRVAHRMPDRRGRQSLILRDGYHCRFCGIPVIRTEVRARLKKLLPLAVRWGRSNASQHAAFQAMWLQYDHLVPHARGGDNSLENMVITCAPCNYARMNYTLDEVGLQNPLGRPARQSEWDGLERVLSIPRLARTSAAMGPSLDPSATA